MSEDKKEFAPQNDEGKFKPVPEWDEDEVWGWLQTLPYGSKLSKGAFEFTNGELLAELDMDQLVTLGVPGPLIPRLHADIDTKVVGMERMIIEADQAEEAEEEKKRQEKRKLSIDRKKTQKVVKGCGCIPTVVEEGKYEMVCCGCWPKAMKEVPVKRQFVLGEGEEDERHEVRVQLFINSIGKIDSSSETWEADFWLRAIWNDDHIKEVRGSDEDFRDDWDDPEWFQPKLEVVNSHALDIVMEQKFVDGDEIYLEQRWRGTLHSDMDLHAFPYDQQKLRIDVESSFHATKFIKLVTAADDAALYSKKCEDHSEFKILWATLDSDINKLEFVTEDDADFERYSLILHVGRRSGFYVGKVGLINLICVIIGCSINFISPEEPGDKLGITTTMFLTLVAFQFVIADQMPKIGYFTLLDYLVLVCYVIMMANVLQTLIQYNRTVAGVDPEELFDDDYKGFVVLMAILFGAAIVLSFYGIKAFFESILFSQGPPKVHNEQHQATEEKAAEKETETKE